MKAQAALAEALVAAVIFATAGAIVAGMSYHTSLFRPSSTNMQNAEFDIESIAYSNTYFGKCMTDSNTSCISSMLRSINVHYKLSYSKLQVGGTAADSGNYSLCGNSDHFCFPLLVNASYVLVCEYTCSD